MRSVASGARFIPYRPYLSGLFDLVDGATYKQEQVQGDIDQAT